MASLLAPVDVSALSDDDQVLNHGGLRDAAHVMNVRHRESKMAQKKCSELYLLLLLAQKPEVRAERPTMFLLDS